MPDNGRHKVVCVLMCLHKNATQVICVVVCWADHSFFLHHVLSYFIRGNIVVRFARPSWKNGSLKTYSSLCVCFPYGWSMSCSNLVSELNAVLVGILYVFVGVVRYGCEWFDSASASVTLTVMEFCYRWYRKLCRVMMCLFFHPRRKMWF